MKDKIITGGADTCLHTATEINVSAPEKREYGEYPKQPLTNDVQNRSTVNPSSDSLDCSTLYIDDQNYIRWRLTPWDKRVFQKNTAEIIQWEFDSAHNAKRLLAMFEQEAAPELSYGRFNASDLTKKRVLVDERYLLCETALDLSIPDLNRYELADVYRNHKIRLRPVEKPDITEIREIAASMFNYSRFHEDPYIATSLANQRMKNWIGDLWKNKIPGLIYRDKNEALISFLFYKEYEDKVDFILGGSREGKGLVSPIFFSAAIVYFREKGLKKVVTKVSAANNGIFNLYMNLGFKVNETLFDYHKHH